MPIDFVLSEDGKVALPAKITTFQVRGRTLVGIVNKETYLVAVRDSEEEAIKLLSELMLEVR